MLELGWEFLREVFSRRPRKLQCQCQCQSQRIAAEASNALNTLVSDKEESLQRQLNLAYISAHIQVLYAQSKVKIHLSFKNVSAVSLVINLDGRTNGRTDGHAVAIA